MSEVKWEKTQNMDFLDDRLLQRHILKQKINKSENNTYFKERDVFYISMGKNVKFEQNGKWPEFARPVVIIKKFNNDLFWWVALSTVPKNWKYYFTFELNGIRQYAIL